MNIIRYYKEKEFNEIPKKNLLDFVRIHRNTEREIVESWERHFESVGSPYAIEIKGKEMILWKERRV